MPFIWEVEEAAWHALQLRGGEGLHALANRHAIVAFTMNDEQWRLPILDEAVRRELVVGLLQFAISASVGMTSGK